MFQVEKKSLIVGKIITIETSNVQQLYNLTFWYILLLSKK